MNTENNKLFVGNISWNTNEEILEQAFAEAGEVLSVIIIKDKITKKSKGYGFVEMATPEAKQAAIEKWNEQELDGRQIFVKPALPKK